MTLFVLAASGAGRLLGTITRHEQHAAGIMILLGLGLVALGGCMARLNIFSPTMRHIAHDSPI